MELEPWARSIIGAAGADVDPPDGVFGELVEGLLAEEEAEAEGVPVGVLDSDVPHPRFRSPPRLGGSLDDDDEEDEEEDRSMADFAFFFCLMLGFGATRGGQKLPQRNAKKSDRERERVRRKTSAERSEREMILF